MSRPAYHLISFGTDGPAPARDLARLHAALLPESPVSRLGSRFMRDFYYRVLPREALLFGAVAYVDAQPAGFIAATHDRTGFMRTAFERAWPRLLAVLGASVLSGATSMRAMWQAAQVMRGRSQAALDTRVGEILSLGVLPAYRHPAFVRQSGIRIATDLLDLAVDDLRAMGVQQIGAAVRADNTEAKLFYASLGWRLDGPRVAGGRPAAVEFVWRPAG
jgi:ribosomal protein S18 acetylase RimI-like enzyme